MLTETQRAALAARLRRDRADGTGGTAIPRRPPGLTAPPLSHGQEQLWFLDRLAPGLPTYNIPHAVRLRGPLDTAALGAALDRLAARHETLRTSLVAGADGGPVQVIAPPAAGPPLPVTDLSGLAPGQRQARLAGLAHAEALRPFTLAEGPLLRAQMLRLAGDEHVLLIVVHHTVFDGWSAQVFLRDLAALYESTVTGEPARLAELPVQFADYAVWERGQAQGGALAEHAQYWRQAMAGYSTVAFPTDRPRPVLEDFAGALADRMTEPGLLASLRALSRREGTTLFVTLMAALMALLHRYTGQDDLVVGTVSASRARPELAGLIGFLVNTLPIRADMSGDPPFTEVLARVKKAILDGYAHQDLPFGKLVEALGAERDPSRAPVFQIAFSYAEPDAAPVTAGGVEFALTDLITGINAAKFDLDLLAEARPGGLWFECSYKTTLFGAATIERLLEHFEVLLRGVAGGPSARLSQLPVLTPAQLHRELAGWNDTAAVLPVICVHEGFEAQVRRTPAAVAAESGEERVSYAELNRSANQIARRLRAAGVGPEALVGVCMTPSLRRLAALLAIWKAGGGYVPLDPGLPAQRLSFMMADAAMPVVLTGADELPGGPATRARVIPLDREWPAIARLPGGDLAGTGVTPENVAYVIYTSGSTGQPKGVVIEHRQAANFLYGMISVWSVGPDDASIAFASLSFDASVQDLFVPLLAGGRVVLVPPQAAQSPARLASLMRASGATLACLTPSVLRLLDGEPFPGLRVLLAGGEELPPDLARRWLRPGLRFVNDYGPTEATVSSLFAELASDTPLPPPIGWPNPNYRAYVLDAHLNPVPVGAVGELHIGGAGVARGYLNRPALTRERFIADPFVPGERLYKTGDLVRRRCDGSIVFTGRADAQVKLRGLRIELGEIEAALAACPAVAQAVAAVVPGPAGERQLAAYLRPEPATEPDPAQVRAHLARTLPAHMIPTYLATVTEFPLSPSGKIDRSALPPPGPAAASQHTAPATAAETVLCGLYAAVLGERQIGATDSFFQLGGSSLQVMRLTDLISRELGVDVGMTTVFLHPTPRQLAASIEAIREGGGGPDGPVTELSRGGPGTLPLFLIHAVGGTVLPYAQLAGELAGAFRVYGIQAPALTGAGATAATLAALAGDYTRRVTATQPVGPYRLAGWSMGGVVAFEAARRLEQAGEQVALLVLLDAPFRIPDVPGLTPPQLAGLFLADAAASLGWDTASLPDPAVATAAEQITWLAQRLGGEGGDVTARLWERFAVFQAHTRMLAGYQPSAPAVRAPALIVSAAGSLNAPARTQWPRVLGGQVRTLPVDSDHYTFLRPPLVTGVGAAIRSIHHDLEQERMDSHPDSRPRQRTARPVPALERHP